MMNRSKSLLQVIGALGTLFLAGCLAGNPNADKQTTPQPPTAPVQAQKPPQSPDPATTMSFKEGTTVGYKEGRSWGRDKGNGLPQEFVLQHMANGWAEQKGNSGDDAWKLGWIDGFKNGFASTRGGKRSLEENPSYENLSPENVKVGTKLYNNAEKHEATIVTVDKEGGLIYVRYFESGSVEPKSIAALSGTWFVKK